MQAQCEMESVCWFRDCLLSQIVVGPWRQRASLRPGPRGAFLRPGPRGASKGRTLAWSTQWREAKRRHLGNMDRK